MPQEVLLKIMKKVDKIFKYFLVVTASTGTSVLLTNIMATIKTPERDFLIYKFLNDLQLPDF
jgi:hypothetical protein